MNHQSDRMKRFILNNTIINSILNNDQNTNENYFQTYLDKEIELDEVTIVDAEIILDKIFKDFYYYQSFFNSEKRAFIINFLLKSKDLFEKAINYDTFLIMIFIHLVTIKQYDHVVIEIDKYLDDLYKIDYQVYEPDLKILSYIQYRAAFYHFNHQNELAKKQLEYIIQGYPERNIHFLATTYFLLSLVYIANGQLDQAIVSCKETEKLSLETSNYKRYFYSQMNLARTMSALGGFDEAIKLYRECLDGADNLHLDMKTVLLEYIATVMMYNQDYQKAIETLNKINREDISNNSAYIYAFCFLQLNNKAKCFQWIEIGKTASNTQPSADRYLILIEKIARQDEQMIHYLKDFREYESTTENYGSYQFLNKLLIHYLIESEQYKEACFYAGLLD